MEICVDFDGALPRDRDLVLIARYVALKKVIPGGSTRVDARIEGAYAPRLDFPPDVRNESFELKLPYAAEGLAGTELDLEFTDTDRKTKLKRRAVLLQKDETKQSFVLQLTRMLPRGRNFLLPFKLSGYRPIGYRFKTTAIPKAREDAWYFLSLQRTWNKEGDDRYAYDVKIAPTLFSLSEGGAWGFGPRIEARVGDPKAGLPNDGRAGFALRREWNSDLDEPRLIEHKLEAAPTFWSDRGWDNKDIGVDVTYKLLRPKLNWPLERKARNEDKKEDRLGWLVRFEGGLEAGEHEKSTSPVVEGESFERARVGIEARLEFERFFLNVRAEHRFLFGDEVVLTTAGVTSTSEDDQTYVRADLARDFGSWTIGFVYDNGRKPPAFVKVDSLALAVGLKY